MLLMIVSWIFTMIISSLTKFAYSIQNTIFFSFIWTDSFWINLDQIRIYDNHRWVLKYLFSLSRVTLNAYCFQYAFLCNSSIESFGVIFNKFNHCLLSRFAFEYVCWTEFKELFKVTRVPIKLVYDYSYCWERN